MMCRTTVTIYYYYYYYYWSVVEDKADKKFSFTSNLPTSSSVGDKA